MNILKYKIFKAKKIHKHEEVREKIKNILVASSVLSLTIVVNSFTIPVFFGSLELEKLEFGLILVFLLANKVKNKILYLTVILLPLIDQLIHAHHNFLTTFFEVFFGIFVTTLIIFFKKIFIKNDQNYRNHFQFFFICLTILIFARFFHFYLFLTIFFNTGDIGDFFLNKKECVENGFLCFIKNINLWTVLPLFPIIIVKFFIIISTTIFTQK